QFHGARRPLRPRRQRELLRLAVAGRLDRLDVQPLLVAEVIVYGRDIDSRPLTDFPDSGPFKPLVGEDLPCRLQHAAWRGVRQIRFGAGWHGRAPKQMRGKTGISIAHFKVSYQTNV